MGEILWNTRQMAMHHMASKIRFRIEYVIHTSATDSTLSFGIELNMSFITLLQAVR